tara:strand:- start:84 stop:641 length:558 start_codon:yes stop_codon:yes gene_type:complete
MKKLRHGFKAEAERIAICVRRDLDLGEWVAIDPWLLAEQLGYQVTDLSAFTETHPQEVAVLRRYTGPKGFSALTICAGNDSDRLIILNDGHGLARRAADLSHELAHGLLLHSSEMFGAGGRSQVDIKDEAEANWLGPALLVPRPAAQFIIREKYSTDQAAQIYGVSEQLLKMRIQVTGVKKNARY